MGRDMVCDRCQKFSSGLNLQGDIFVCRHCYVPPSLSPLYFKEMGRANPFDPKGSTAHVRDIEDRRWHPTEKRMFYYSKEKPKTYYFPKGN